MAIPASCALRGTDRWRTRVVNARGAAVGPRLPGPAARNGSAYGGAPAASTRAREVVGAAESDPYLKPAVHRSIQDNVDLSGPNRDHGNAAIRDRFKFGRDRARPNAVH